MDPMDYIQHDHARHARPVSHDSGSRGFTNHWAPSDPNYFARQMLASGPSFPREHYPRDQHMSPAPPSFGDQHQYQHHQHSRPRPRHAANQGPFQFGHQGGLPPPDVTGTFDAPQGGHFSTPLAQPMPGMSPMPPMPSMPPMSPLAPRSWDENRRSLPGLPGGEAPSHAVSGGASEAFGFGNSMHGPRGLSFQPSAAYSSDLLPGASRSLHTRPAASMTNANDNASANTGGQNAQTRSLLSPPGFSSDAARFSIPRPSFPPTPPHRTGQRLLPTTAISPSTFNAGSDGSHPSLPPVVQYRPPTFNLPSPTHDRRRSTHSRARRSAASRQTGSDPAGMDGDISRSRAPMDGMPGAAGRRGSISIHPGEAAVRELQAARGAVTSKMVASKTTLHSLQSVKIADLPEDDRTCVICYNDFGVESPEGHNEAPLRLPKCKHVFGDHCIKKWLDDSDSCPYCRDKLHSEPKHHGVSARAFLNMMRMRGMAMPTGGGMPPEMYMRFVMEAGLGDMPPRQSHPAERRAAPEDAGEPQRRTRARHGTYISPNLDVETTRRRPPTSTDVTPTQSPTGNTSVRHGQVTPRTTPAHRRPVAFVGGPPLGDDAGYDPPGDYSEFEPLEMPGASVFFTSPSAVISRGGLPAYAAEGYVAGDPVTMRSPRGFGSPMSPRQRNLELESPILGDGMVVEDLYDGRRRTWSQNRPAE